VKNAPGFAARGRSRHGGGRPLGGFYFDFFRRLLCFGFFRVRHGQHTLGEFCLDLVGIDAVRQLKNVLERADISLAQVIFLLLFLFLFPGARL
jgi:hypothetical protein